MTSLLAFDPAQAFGVAWTEDGSIDPERSASWNLKEAKSLGARMVLLLEHVKRCPVRPRYVVMENAFSRSDAWARWLYGYQAIVAMWAEWIGARLTLVEASKLKVWATGRGSPTDSDLRKWGKEAEKERMRAAAIRRWPEHAQHLRDFDHNRVDAMLLLAWGIEQLGETS